MVLVQSLQGFSAAILVAGALGQSGSTEPGLMYDLDLFRASGATPVITAPAAGDISDESIDLMCWCIVPPPRVAASVPLVPEAPVVEEDDSLTVALR